MDKLREGFTAHFFHDPRSMDFDCSRTDIEFSGDYFIGVPSHHQLHDLRFPFGEAAEPSVDVLPKDGRSPPLSINGHGPVDRVEEF